MNILIISISIFIVICMLLVWIISTYNKFQEYIIRINEAETNIDSTLRNRCDLLNKSIDIIKANTDIEGDILISLLQEKTRFKRV